MLKKFLLPSVLIFFAAFLAIFLFNQNQKPTTLTGAPPYGEAESEALEIDPYEWLRNWVRPDGPTKVALQVGHWQSDEAPEELKRLRSNTGASGGGKSEWEVNYKIALETKKNLEEQGILVEILPVTIPEKYYADVFVAIHADGNPDDSKTGYKTSPPWRDFSGKSQKLSDYIEQSYEAETGLSKDPNITRNMRGYYAFSWWRYKHAVHPMTPSVILETGFLTSPGDRKLIVDQPEISAQGLSLGIINFLKDEGMLN